MKKIIFLLFAFTGVIALYGQLTITTSGNGVVELHYGGSNDYSIYDPQGDATIYVYLWVNTDQTSPPLTQQYNDDWNDASSLETLTYDTQAGEFVGTIDFNTHNFPGEGVIPQNTTLNDFNLILRNQAGDRQSADLLASDYGFTQTTLHTEIMYNDRRIFVRDGFIRIPDDLAATAQGLEIYSITGKLLSATEHVTDMMALPETSSKIVIIKLIAGKRVYINKVLVE